VRLGRRFDPPRNAADFMEELEREFTKELADAPQALWLGETSDPPDNRIVQTE
jgi:hypothetical protein